MEEQNFVLVEVNVGRCSGYHIAWDSQTIFCW